MQPTTDITMNLKTKNITIATWNLCLGLRNKKDYVSKIINEHKLDIVCLQETEIEPNYPLKILSFKGYDYLTENNSEKARTGIYINSNIPYLRRIDLEKPDCGIIIIDLDLTKKYRILCLYRVFSPNNQISQYTYFKNQMDMITETCADKTKISIIMGDFNLDENQRNNSQYSHHRYYNLLQDRFSELNMIQLIKFNTWSRLVGNTLKESCLDHIYTNDSTSITNINNITPIKKTTSNCDTKYENTSKSTKLGHPQ